VPRLYLIPSEQPNAFATVRDPEHAAVAVTEGLLEQLPADQVRGVVGRLYERRRVRGRTDAASLGSCSENLIR
jgi:hypothetical protein